MAKETRSQAKAAPRLATQTDLSGNAMPEIAEALNGLVADSYALYTKTKNFHWHVSGPHFRDYHLLFDEQAAEIFATIDDLAERVRKLGARTVHSIGEIARLQTIKDNDKDFVSPGDMLRELMNDNKTGDQGACARRMKSPTSMTMSPPPRSWKTSSTRPRSGTGSCSRPAARHRRRPLSLAQKKARSCDRAFFAFSREDCQFGACPGWRRTAPAWTCAWSGASNLPSMQICADCSTWKLCSFSQTLLSPLRSFQTKPLNSGPGTGPAGDCTRTRPSRILNIIVLPSFDLLLTMSRVSRQIFAA